VLFVLHPGNIHAAERPPQDVSVVNAPNVHVVNTPSVNVTNPVTIDTSANPVAVRDVREAGRVLFQWSGSVQIPFEEVTGFTSLNVPAGKRLEIQ
jgi:hypothetical protein